MTTTSDRIRARLLAAGQRFRANDNIAAYIEPGELDALTQEVAERVAAVLESLVIDTENDHNTRETGLRVARMYVGEVFAGRYSPAPDLTAFPNVTSYDELYLVGPVTIRSTCAHHLQNIRGNCWIGIYPGKNVLGLSKFYRLTEWIAARPADPGGDDHPDRGPRRNGDRGRRRRRRRQGRAHVRDPPRRPRACIGHDDLRAARRYSATTRTRAPSSSGCCRE